MGCLLLVGHRTVAADDDEKPDNVVAFPNSPGMITLTWTHSGDDVYWFVLEQESPAAGTQVDRDKRVWSVPNLEPSRTYRYRVCAVYAFHRKCSDEDGAGLASVTTLPPQASGGGGPAGSTPPRHRPSRWQTLSTAPRYERCRSASQQAMRQSYISGGSTR